MAYRLTVYIVEPTTKTIHVEHNFYGDTEAQALDWKRRHLGVCEYFRAQELAGNTVEQGETIDQEDRPYVVDVDSKTIEMEEIQ